MAGITKLQAINRMLMSIRLGRAPALDTGGSSDAANAEIILDQVIDSFIIAGHPSTTKAAQLYTASAAGVVDVGSGTEILAVRGVGKHAGKKFTLRGTEVYDEAYGSTQCFASSEANIILDLHFKPSSESPNNFELLDPGMRIAVLDEAVRQYRVMMAPDPTMDAALARIQDGNREAGIGQPDRRVERPAAPTPQGQTIVQQRRNPLG
jgi:hypothetical protein